MVECCEGLWLCPLSQDLFSVRVELSEHKPPSLESNLITKGHSKFTSLHGHPN